MDLMKQGWFTEKCELWPGQCFSLEVEEVLFDDKSDYQHILVLKTKSHGNVLVLDGIIQCTEHDEFVYQEMISFLPLCAHKNPLDVLIVGGGDGGVAREVGKDKRLKTIHQVEIDGLVIDAVKKYLPSMACGFNSEKLMLHIGDGFEYMRNHSGEFDIIITDSSDPVGPAANLFTEAYFQLLKQALKPNGIICSQGGTIWSEFHHVVQTVKNCKKHFANVRYAVASVPTYPNGQIGFLIATDDTECNLENPSLILKKDEIKELNLRYYNSDMHRSAFVLPNFAKEAFL